jgi:hypothetical protein
VTLRDAAPTSRAMVVAVMVSMVAFLDSTVINLALPATEHDLGGGLAVQQWIVDGWSTGSPPSSRSVATVPRPQRQ